MPQRPPTPPAPAATQTTTAGNQLFAKALAATRSPSGAPGPMSRQELAEAVNAELAQQGVKGLLTDKDIGRFIRGETRWPRDHYRAALRTVLGITSDRELGFYRNRNRTQAPAPELSSSVAAATIVPETTGREVEETNRRQALTTALGLTGVAIEGSGPRTSGVSALSLLGTLPPDPDQLEPEQGGGAAAYHEMSQRLWRMYWDAPARPLFEAAYAHVRLGVDLVGGVSGADRRRLTGAVALSALLTGRLAFFDLNRPGAATRCHQVALAAANEAGDDTLVAVVLGHMAFGPAFARDPERGREATVVALANAQRTNPPIRSWLHCVASEVEARAGNGAASLRQIDLADATFTVDEPAPEWFDFYDPARLDCFAGYAATAAGHHQLAADRLCHAVTELGRKGSKQRSVVCSDLATAYPGDPDRAAHHLCEAVDALETSWYEVGWDRVRAARALLGDSRLGRQVDQRLAILPGGRR